MRKHCHCSIELAPSSQLAFVLRQRLISVLHAPRFNHACKHPKHAWYLDKAWRMVRSSCIKEDQLSTWHTLQKSVPNWGCLSTRRNFGFQYRSQITSRFYTIFGGNAWKVIRLDHWCLHRLGLFVTLQGTSDNSSRTWEPLVWLLSCFHDYWFS